MNSNSFLNPKLDINKLAANFAENNFVVIDNYLKPEFIGRLYSEFANSSKTLWATALRDHSSEDFYGERSKLKASKNADALFKAKYKLKLKKLLKECQNFSGKGVYSFAYERTSTKKLADTAIESEFKNFLVSEGNFSFLSSVVGQQLTNLVDSYMSKFSSGHFVSVRQDNIKAKVHFILNLTPEWLPQWGGMFHLCSKDFISGVNLMPAKFNTLIIVKNLDKFRSSPYFISHVAPEVEKQKMFYNAYFI